MTCAAGRALLLPRQEDESGSPEPREQEASGLVASAVNEALLSGSERVLVQDGQSQLWAFYADGPANKRPNGELAACVRGGGDDSTRRGGAPLPRSGPGGSGGRLPRSYRRRGGPREGCSPLLLLLFSIVFLWLLKPKSFVLSVCPSVLPPGQKLKEYLTRCLYTVKFRANTHP